MQKGKRLSTLAVHSFNTENGGTSGVPLIKCSFCGAELMLVPNVTVMSEVIEAHVEQHKQKIKDPKAAQEEGERVRADLITQVLEKASKS
jgi:hypothetical protein